MTTSGDQLEDTIEIARRQLGLAITELHHEALLADDLSEADAIGRSRCVVGACHPPTEPVRCVFAADYETTPWRCERLAGHEGAHRSGPVAPSER